MRHDMIRRRGIKRRTSLLNCSDERARLDWHLYIMIPHDIPGVFRRGVPALDFN